MFKFLTSKKGYTLVELMIVLALLGLGAVAFMNFFSAAYTSFDKSEERYKAQEDVKSIAAQLRQGSSNVASSKSVNVFNTLDVLPQGSEVDTDYSYIYAQKEKIENSEYESYFIYCLNRGQKREDAKKILDNPISDNPMYVTIKPISETAISDGKNEPRYFNGVTITIAALETSFVKETADGLGEIPLDDDIYYSLDVTYHFPNMVTSEENILVNHLGGNGKLYVTNDGITATHCEKFCSWYGCNPTHIDTERTEANATTGQTEDICDPLNGICHCKSNNGIVLAVDCDSIIDGDNTNSDIEPPSLCFIATASYGQGSSQVGQLCEFRDNTLMKSALGRAFVEAYYKLSPPIADTIRESEPLKAVVRTALKPLIIVAEYANNEEIRAEGIISVVVFMSTFATGTAILIRLDKKHKREKRQRQLAINN